MTETTKHAPGAFCWPELATTDQKAAKKFYSALFDWGINDQPMGPDAVYTMFTVEGKEVSAAHQMDPGQIAQGVPPHWFSYVAVPNADDALATAGKLGGKIVMNAFDVMDAGRMGVVQDPAGAMFGVWQANKHIGARLVNQPRTLVWTELLSTNVDAAREFYTKLFGYGQQIHDMGPMKYTVFMREGEVPTAGLMQVTPDMGNMPSNWLPYFGVDDPDATAAKAKSLGGTVLMEPMDVPRVGRFSVIQDTQNATFGIARFLPPQS